MFQQHLAIFHKSRPSAGVVPTPTAPSDQWFLQKLSRTGGGAKWGGRNNWGGAFATSCPPPGAATVLNDLLQACQQHVRFYMRHMRSTLYYTSSVNKY